MTGGMQKYLKSSWMMVSFVCQNRCPENQRLDPSNDRGT